MKKLLLLFASLIIAMSQMSAANYPDKMYIKAKWESSWKWKEMTTTADGIYTIVAPWNDFSGSNIHTKASDSGAAWFPKASIVGYDANVITKGAQVALIYSTSTAQLYVGLESEPQVVLMLSTAELTVDTQVTLSSYCRGLEQPTFEYNVTDPDGVTTALDATTPTITLAKAGDYTFSVKATDATNTAACSLTRNVAEPPTPCPFTPTADEKAHGFHEDAVTHDITFVFDPATWSTTFNAISKVHVSGSFNGWSGSGNDDFRLVKDAMQGIFYLTVPYNTVKKPGNIGQPEFKFVVDGSYCNPYSGYPSDYIYNSNGNKNCLVVFSFDDINELRQTISDSSVLKSISDFDLTTREGQEEVSNYRQVPATLNLYRCYHPFKSSSRTDMSTEPYRLQYVAALSEADGIKADICLSDDDTGNLGSFTANGQTYTETIPAYYQQLIDGGHVLYVGKGYSIPSYNDVYYNNTEERFARWISDVVDFIIDDANDGPFTIHCRLGTDRTGVFCATLAALCGASWDDVAADYQKTNRMGINEYRSYKLLKYAFENMLGVTDLNSVANFSAAVTDNLINRGAVTAEKVAKLKTKLNPTTGIIGVSTDKTDNDTVIVHNMLGIKVYEGNISEINLPAGLYIVDNEKVYVK